MEDLMMTIGQRIKDRRRELGLSQTDIYEKCGIASGVLSRIENGKNVPSAIAFYTLAQVLETDMTWLMTGVSTNMQNTYLCVNEERLVSGFRELSEEDQEELLDILDLKLRKVKRDAQKMVKSSNSEGEDLGNKVG